MSEDTHENDISSQVIARRGRKPGIKVPAKSHDDDGEAVEVERSVAPHSQAVVNTKFPVKLLRNYHPVNDFTIDGEPPIPEQRVKVFAGANIEIDVDEAEAMIKKGIAVRNDPIRR